MKTDIIIIGAGPAGYETAIHAAKHNRTVTIIESAKAGGTCLNEGCIPTKAFCKNASLLEELKEGEAFGLENLTYNFNLAKVVERKNRIVASLVNGIEFLLKNKLINYVKGDAILKDKNTVIVEDKEYSADYLIIATGSVSKNPAIEGISLPKVITSKEILDIDHVPENLCIIGAGVIGLEFASIFNAFGSKVTVLEYMKDILPGFDTDITKRLKQILVKKGIEIINQAAVLKIEEKSNNRLSVNYTYKGEDNECTASTVLIAIGRKPNIGSLNVSDIGIEFSDKGIVTNEYMQTNIPSVYAIGDINGQCMLAHAATFQGIKALNHILGIKDSIRPDIMPAAVFTLPEAATVGLTEDKCKEKGIVFKSRKSFFRSNGKAVSMGEPEGFCKLISDENDKIIGCHLFGAHAADLIHEISSLINMDANINDYGNIIHAHPTLSEVIQDCIR